MGLCFEDSCQKEECCSVEEPYKQAYIAGRLDGANIQQLQGPIIYLTVGPATLRIERKLTQRQMSMLADFVKDIKYSDVCVQREEEESPAVVYQPPVPAAQDCPTIEPQF